MLNERSRNNLVGVHPDLVRVVERAAELSPVPVVVTEGLRSAARQKELKAAGKSWTLNSRHLNGHAIDLVDGDDFKYDIPDMDSMAVAMKAAAAELGVPITWGGDWKTRDTPHFELDWKAYPETGMSFVSRMKEKAVDAAVSKPGVVTIGTGVGAGIAKNVDKLPDPPDLTQYIAWKTFGQTVVDLGTWMGAHPWITIGVGGWVVTILFWNQIKAAISKWRPA